MRAGFWFGQRVLCRVILRYAGAPLSEERLVHQVSNGCVLCSPEIGEYVGLKSNRQFGQ